MNDSTNLITIEDPYRPGQRLPIIDMTNQAFQKGLAERSGYLKKYIDRLPLLGLRLLSQLPGWLKAPITSRSLIVRDFLSKSPYLTSEATYVMKLGRFAPQWLDRLVGASPQSLGTTQRLEQISKLMSKRIISERDHSELHFVSVGSGNGMDVVNALLLATKNDRKRMHRLSEISVYLLDTDEKAMKVAKRSLAELTRGDRPLANLNIQVSTAAFNWQRPQNLSSVLDGYLKRR